jgi:hypothetical protein
MSAGGNFYMSAALRWLESITINVQTDLIEKPPQTGAFVHYPRWSAVVFAHDEWFSIFEFRRVGVNDAIAGPAFLVGPNL